MLRSLASMDVPFAALIRPWGLCPHLSRTHSRELTQPDPTPERRRARRLPLAERDVQSESRPASPSGFDVLCPRREHVAISRPSGRHSSYLTRSGLLMEGVKTFG